LHEKKTGPLTPEAHFDRHKARHKESLLNQGDSKKPFLPVAEKQKK